MEEKLRGEDELLGSAFGECLVDPSPQDSRQSGELTKAACTKTKPRKTKTSSLLDTLVKAEEAVRADR